VLAFVAFLRPLAAGHPPMAIAYNIFRKTPDTPLVWVAAAENIDGAKKGLNQLDLKRARGLSPRKEML
jgi:hypothetical protein